MFVPAKYKDCYTTFILNELAGSTCMVGVLSCFTWLRCDRIACWTLAACYNACKESSEHGGDGCDVQIFTRTCESTRKLAFMLRNLVSRCYSLICLAWPCLARLTPI
jgi:hypothetical protein